MKSPHNVLTVCPDCGCCATWLRGEVWCLWCSTIQSPQRPAKLAGHEVRVWHVRPVPKKVEVEP